MERRQFVSQAVLTVAAATAASHVPAHAAGRHRSADTNVIFTARNPGHWSGLEKLHVPKLEVSGRTLTVTTPHPMSAEHYIVSHTVVLDGGHYLGRHTFMPTDKPVSTHELPDGFKGMVTVTSTCNQHDWWMVRTRV